MAEMMRKHVYVSGRVQGVGFRASVRSKARQLGVKGWVKNLADGRVEVVLTGNEKNVKELLNYIKNGPRLALVHDVKVEDEEFQDDFSTFYIEF